MFDKLPQLENERKKLAVDRRKKIPCPDRLSRIEPPAVRLALQPAFKLISIRKKASESDRTTAAIDPVALRSCTISAAGRLPCRRRGHGLFYRRRRRSSTVHGGGRLPPIILLRLSLFWWGRGTTWNFRLARHQRLAVRSRQSFFQRLRGLRLVRGEGVINLGSLVGSLANFLVPGQVVTGPQQTLHRIAGLVLAIEAGLAHARPGTETVPEIL